MNSKANKKDFEFIVPVTSIKNMHGGHSTKLIGNLLIVGTGYKLPVESDSEEKYGVKLSHINWNDINILPLARLTPSMEPFLNEVLEMANNQCANVLFNEQNLSILQ